MTTGSYSTGDFQYSPYGYVKSWSGYDGKFDADGLEKFNIYHVGITKGNQHAGPGFTGYPDSGWPGYTWPSLNLSWDGSADSEVLSKLAGRIRGHSFELGVALAEGKEAVTMVVDTLGKFIKCISSLRKGRIDLALRALGAAPKAIDIGNPLTGGFGKKGGGKRLSKNQIRSLDTGDISAMWLELQYGWSPLLSDCFAAMEAFAALANKPRHCRLGPVRVKRKKDGVNSNEYGATTWLSEESRKLWYQVTEDVSVARSLGLTDPMVVLWELIPFSFVADWFIPIGNYLDQLAEIPNLHADIWFTQYQHSEARFVGNAGTAYDGAWSRSEQIWIERFVLSIQDYPMPFPKFKPLSTALSSGHIKNAIALLHQLVVQPTIRKNSRVSNVHEFSST